METFDPKGAVYVPVTPHVAAHDILVEPLPFGDAAPPARRGLWSRLLALIRRGGEPGVERLPEILPPASHDPPEVRARLVTPSAALAAGGPAIWLRYPH